ncbi:hypothetical protein BKA70DRAFT_1076557, partial [Coprinopsis sp. MPI-PUGE-AT-0042]
PKVLIPEPTSTLPPIAATTSHPSATWRKDLPAVLSRKRARSQASVDEPDALNGDQDDEELARHEMSPPGTDATESRHQHMLAERNSPKRKLEDRYRLGQDVKALTRERDCWRTRAGVLVQVLVSRGVP